MKPDDRDYRRLGYGGSGAARMALDAARRLSPESLDETRSPSCVLRFTTPNGGSLSRAARDALNVVTEAYRAGRIDVNKARALAALAVGLKDAPVKHRAETIAAKNDARIQGLQGALALTPAERAELLRRHQAKGAVVKPVTEEDRLRFERAKLLAERRALLDR